MKATHQGGYVHANIDIERARYINRILQNASWANMEALERVLGRHGQANGLRLVAECPPPPAEVRATVSKVQHKFHEVFIAFEADWREDVSVPLDPLVIGVNASGSFLLAVYDPTKLEHYIASEFTSL